MRNRKSENTFWVPGAEEKSLKEFGDMGEVGKNLHHIVEQIKRN